MLTKNVTRDIANSAIGRLAVVFKIKIRLKVSKHSMTMQIFCGPLVVSSVARKHNVRTSIDY